MYFDLDSPIEHPSICGYYYYEYLEMWDILYNGAKIPDFVHKTQREEYVEFIKEIMHQIWLQTHGRGWPTRNRPGLIERERYHPMNYKWTRQITYPSRKRSSYPRDPCGYEKEILEECRYEVALAYKGKWRRMDWSDADDYIALLYHERCMGMDRRLVSLTMEPTPDLI